MLEVDVRQSDIAIRRPASSSLDRDTTIWIALSEIPKLITDLQNARPQMAKAKREQAAQLFAEAVQLEAEMA